MERRTLILEDYPEQNLEFLEKEGIKCVACSLARGVLADLRSLVQVLSVWDSRQQGTLPLLLASCALFEQPLIAFRHFPLRRNLSFKVGLAIPREWDSVH